MKRHRTIGVVGRPLTLGERPEIYDGVDANLQKILVQAGLVPITLSSYLEDPVNSFKALSLAGFVLSGGGNVGDPPERALLESVILQYASDRSLPVLGICRGMQVMVTWLGGAVEPGEGHVMVRHHVDFPNETKRLVNSFHEFVVHSQQVPPCLKPLALASDRTVEAVQHDSLPWLGIMWHPEREAPFHSEDISLIMNLFGS